MRMGCEPHDDLPKVAAASACRPVCYENGVVKPRNRDPCDTAHKSVRRLL